MKTLQKTLAFNATIWPLSYLSIIEKAYALKEPYVFLHFVNFSHETI